MINRLWGKGLPALNPHHFFLKGDLHISRTPNPKPPINGPFDVIKTECLFQHNTNRVSSYSQTAGMLDKHTAFSLQSYKTLMKRIRVCWLKKVGYLRFGD